MYLMFVSCYLSSSTAGLKATDPAIAGDCGRIRDLAEVSKQLIMYIVNTDFVGLSD